MKALKKQDIIIQFNALQEKYDTLAQQNTVLKEENKNHVESILLLEETVKLLETKSVKQISTGAQTEIIRCEECEFPADCMNDLVYHMYESHPLEENEQKFECNFCSDNFKIKGDLMVHKKYVHQEKVQICTNFIQGTCHFKDGCWFRHENRNGFVFEFDCNYCEERFITRKEFMTHKKSNHKEYVQMCKNYTKNDCQYSSELCWFLHKNRGNLNFELTNENENKVLMKKLIEMIENYSDKINKLDKMMEE